VRKIPNRFDADALHSAAGALPPATEVKAIEACTVDGKAVSRRNPGHSDAGKRLGAMRCAAIPSSGKSANVLRKTSVCNRHCRKPRNAASGESCAPCMKNSYAMAASVSQPTANAASLRAGITQASPTVSRMAARNRSMRDQIGRSQVMQSLVTLTGNRLRLVIVNSAHRYYCNRIS
jgi:hypothetical protein